MSPNCSGHRMEILPSGVAKCSCCGAIASDCYGSWWPDVFPWAKDMKFPALERNKKILKNGGYLDSHPR